MILKILIAALVAFPISGPKVVAQPAPQAPKNIAKIAMNTSSPVIFVNSSIKTVPEQKSTAKLTLVINWEQPQTMPETCADLWEALKGVSSKVEYSLEILGYNPKPITVRQFMIESLASSSALLASLLSTMSILSILAAILPPIIMNGVKARATKATCHEKKNPIITPLVTANSA